MQDLQWLSLADNETASWTQRVHMLGLKVIFVTGVLFRSWRGYLHDTRSEAARVIIGIDAEGTFSSKMYLARELQRRQKTVEKEVAPSTSSSSLAKVATFSILGVSLSMSLYCSRAADSFRKSLVIQRRILRSKDDPRSCTSLGSIKPARPPRPHQASRLPDLPSPWLLPRLVAGLRPAH